MNSPFRILAGELPVNSFVMYEINGEPLLAQVLENRSQRCTVLNERGDELVLPLTRLTSFEPPSRTLRSSTDAPAEVTAKVSKAAKQKIVETLKGLHSQARTLSASLVMEELWQLVKDENNEFSLHSLAELLPVSAPASAENVDGDSLLLMALRISLLEDKIFFRRTEKGFLPRTEAGVEELKRAEVTRLARLAREETLFNLIVDGFKQGTAPIIEDPQLRRMLYPLLRMAAGCEDSDATRRKETKNLVERIENAIANPSRIMPVQAEQTDAFRARYALSLCNVIDLNENLFFIANDIADDFPPEIQELAASITTVPFSLSGPASDEALSESDGRDTKLLLDGAPQLFLTKGTLDLRHLDCLTIDEPTTKDRDDGMSVELVETIPAQAGQPSYRKWRLGIHIANVAALLHQEDPLEELARSRLTSVYCPDKTRHMLPTEIVAQQYSLNAGTERPAVSLLVEYTEDLTLGDCVLNSCTFTESIINITRNWGYEEVDELLKSSENENSVPFRAAFHFAQWLEAQRVARGAQEFDTRDISVFPRADGTVERVEFNSASPARMTIREMMVLYNWMTAEFGRRAIVALPFRTQAAPDDTSPISAPPGYAYEYIAKGRLTRSQWLVEPRQHSSLGLPCYTQATSPIRRYYDLVAQRQLVAGIQGKTAPFNAKQLDNLLEETAAPLAATNYVSRDSRRFWFLKYIAQEDKLGNLFEGTVVRTDDRGVLVQLHQLLFSVPMKKNNKLALGDVISIKITKVDPYADFIRAEVAKP